MSDKQQVPKGRITTSREDYWRNLFNQFSAHQEEHSISGWSPQGLRLRMKAYQQVLSSMELPAEALVLDLGCGAGAYSRFLGAAGFRVVGCDYAWLVAGQAHKRTESENVNFLSGDACRLPFTESLFDHVVCIGLFQSLHKHREAMAEIYRVLRPGGSLCLTTLNRCNLKTRFDRWLKREEMIMVGDQLQARLNTYDPAFFCRELEETGFSDLQCRPVQIYPESLNPLSPLVGLWNRLPGLRYLTARSFMLVGRKVDTRGG